MSAEDEDKDEKPYMERLLERTYGKVVGDLDDYINKLKRIRDNKSKMALVEQACKDLKKCIGELKREGYAENTISNFKWGVLGYLGDHYIRIDAKDADKHVGKFGDELDDVPLDRSEVEQIFYMLHCRYRVFILALTSSGARPAELLRIRAGQINFDHDPAYVRVYDRKASKEDEVEKYLFFTNECTNYLKGWKGQARRSFIRKKHQRGWYRDEVVIHTKDGECEVEDEDLLFPFSLTSVEKAWRDALEAIGEDDYIERGKGKILLHRLYTLRTWWSTKVMNTVGQEKYNMLIAHLSDLQRDYTNFGVDDLASIYNKVRNKLVLGVDTT